MKQAMLICCLMVAASIPAVTGCERSEAEEGMHPFIWARFTSEMKTILRDLQMAEELAAVNEGRYMALSELKQNYFSRPVREGMALTVSDVTETGYSAKLVHGPSGITCGIEVVEGRRGVSKCD